MNIIITGANGFLGSSLVKHFVSKRVRVVALVRKTSNLDRLSSIIGSEFLVMHFIENGVRLAFSEYGHINAVMHTATLYGRNGESATEIMQANELFALEVLEIASFFNTNTFFNTDTILSSNLNHYAVSKNNFVNWGKIFAQIQKIKFINLKLQHLYGAGDDPSKFVDYLISAMLNKIIQIDLTKGDQLRDFIYIDDAVKAYDYLLDNIAQLKPGYSEIDIGSGQTISIRELSILVKKLTQNNETTLNFGMLDYRENEMMKSVADVSFMNSLGWVVETTLEDGLRKYIGDYAK